MSLTIGQRVVYANGLYEIAKINGDLLTLDGLADARRNCRTRVTVLASDVTAIASETTTAGQCGPKQHTATQHTGDGNGGYL